MLKLALTLFVLVVLVACGRAKFATPTQQQVQCITNEANGIIHVNCPNGVYYSFPAPNDGVDGRDGENGTNAQGIRIVDPCGDYVGGVDEVILVFPDNTAIAWYKNVGMVALTPNTLYQTTDGQMCRFKVDVNGNVVTQ